MVCVYCSYELMVEHDWPVIMPAQYRTCHMELFNGRTTY